LAGSQEEEWQEGYELSSLRDRRSCPISEENAEEMRSSQLLSESIDLALSEQKNFCTHCGSKLDPKFEFCLKCGKKLTTQEAVSLGKIDQYIKALSGKSLPQLISILGISLLKEARESRPSISSSIKERGNTHNLYTVSIPTRYSQSGKPGKPMKAYCLKKNAKREGETDEKAAARIMDEINQEVEKNVERYLTAKGRGEIEEANQVLFGTPEEPKLFKSIGAAKRYFSKIDPGEDVPQYTKEQVAAIKKYAQKVREARRSLLRGKGLLSREDISSSLGMKKKGDVKQFASNFLDTLAKMYPKWSELTKARDVSPEEVSENIPSEYSPELVGVLVKMGDIDPFKLSTDAMEALAAAGFIAAGAIISADKKVGQDEQV
jgi:hypothetical protein